MDHTDENDLRYDCFHYRVSNLIGEGFSRSYIHKKPYQIIPYCIRPDVDIKQKNNSIVMGNIALELPFEDLRKKHITTSDLLLWSTNIDLVELYDEYLTLPSNGSLAQTKFYNCTEFWFGSRCQYTFNTQQIYNVSLSFHVIVNKTFSGKDFTTTTTTTSSSMTCYMHLECDRGPAPACFDWREICDGKVDCLDNDLDEIGCFSLEMNECEENEFRCHNGLCIPEEFLNEGMYFVDCLDRSDEDGLSKIKFPSLAKSVHFHCGYNPGFWCEESDSVRHARFFVCGDGEPTTESFLHNTHGPFTWQCRNQRDLILKHALLSFDDQGDLPYDCWLLLYCSTIGYTKLDCSTLCVNNTAINGCFINVTDKCSTDYVVFPQRPIFQGHIQLVYQTNQTIFFSIEEISIFPDYVCYDVRKCPFLSSSSLLNLTGTTCRSTKEFDLHEYIDIQRFFQACFTVLDANNLEMNSTALFQCPGTSKYISKHRVLDNRQDCYLNADETNVDTCLWNDKYRFKCPSENKCISLVPAYDSTNNCLNDADERIYISTLMTYSKFCNGYEHLLPIIINGLNETDETHCENWPCNNIYTRCDGAWNCLNGADELNCELTTQCSLNTHECVSLTNKNITCLPIEQINNGIVDCLGATDERSFCRQLQRKDAKQRYKCLNESVCLNPQVACHEELCQHENKISCSSSAMKILDRLIQDKKLEKPEREHFLLDPLVTPEESVTVLSSDDQLWSSVRRKFDYFRTRTCNRGVLIYTEKHLSMTCLCPPSYYGNRCQYQSQRVSLSLQFTQLCETLCTKSYAIIISLIDEDHIIHDYEQLTYMSTHKCEDKFFIYLLYRIRPKNVTKTYHIQINAYNKINVSYYSSWILPVKFIFLPVNKISAHLYLPANSVVQNGNCSKSCVHGQCMTYVNQPNQQFCHCNSNWSGVNCTIPLSCNCAQDSYCYEKKDNRSICICPSNKYGPRCRLFSVCHNHTCQNGGQCISDDQRISRTQFTCICPEGFFGRICQFASSKIQITFEDIDIPRSIRAHFLTVQKQSDPLHTTISTKIPYDRNFALFYVSFSFHVIIGQLSTNYYLLYVNASYSYSSLLTTVMTAKQQCLHTDNLFENQSLRTYPLLYRVKYYHLFCRNHSQLKCFHDNQDYMCLCNENRFANCFPFNFESSSTCKKIGACQNDGQCLWDRPYCPHSISCVCTDCFYGSKCQFTTKGFGLSLDMILAYHIRPNLAISRQPTIVKTTVGLTVMIFIFGICNSILSILTFHKGKKDEPGCRLYLLAISIVSLFITILFAMKVLMLMLSQLDIIINTIVLKISCIAIDFLFRLCLIIADWVSAGVSIERVLTVILGIKFDKNKSRRAVKWTTSGIILASIVSILHDPIYRTVIYDDDEDRRWCIVQYPSASLQIYNSVINIIHFFIPFLINFIAGVIIIFVAARTRSTVRPNETYSQVLKKQFKDYKHLIISSVSLVLLGTPRLFISFISGCMKSPRNSSLFLAGYFISFVPSCLTFFTFILPSKLYMENFTLFTKKLIITLTQE